MAPEKYRLGYAQDTCVRGVAVTALEWRTYPLAFK